MSLDALKSEIAVKRKLTADDAARPSKYMRRGELEKLKEEQERKEKEGKEKQKRKKEQEEREAAEAKARLKVSCYFSNYFVRVLRRPWRTGCARILELTHARVLGHSEGFRYRLTGPRYWRFQYLK